MAKILVVDDDPMFSKLLRIILEKEGYEIDSVLSGELAIEKVKDFAPDLVMTDIVLPGIDGIETCRQIKSIEEPKTKVIVVTGEIDAVDVVRAREAGADDFCVKTRGLKEILKAIKKIL